jgi:acyl carrier protein
MMTRQDLLAKLAEILETSPDQLTEEAGPNQIPGWDSVAALGVISLLDDAGAGEITTEDAASFKTIGAILSFANARGILSN